MLRRNHRSILLGQTETMLDFVLGRNTAKFTEQCSQTRVFKLRLGEVHSPRPCSESPAPLSSKQTDNQRYVLLVRTDSEKHVEFDLKRRLLAAMTHEMGEESLSARRVQTRSWRPREGNSSLMSRHCRESQACLLDDLRRRKGDMTQPFRSCRSGRVKKKSKLSGSSGDDGENEVQVGTSR